MKFLLDENVDRRLVPYLQSLGHDVKAIATDYPYGLPDRDVLTLAMQEQRILLTNDRTDFGELVFLNHLPHCGILLFRLKSEEGNLILLQERLHHVLTAHIHQLNQFIVITPQNIRVRKTVTHVAA